MNSSEIIVIGGGAAGLTAGIFAAETSASVTVLERARQPGRKILMSGGTRCNVLPVKATLDDYVSNSSRNRLKNIFKSWSVDECHEWFTQTLGLKMACEEETNKWFPVSNSAREVRDRLVEKFQKQGGNLICNASVNSISHDGENWLCTTDDGTSYRAPRLILSSGGLSIPSTGTDGTGHTLVRNLGHSLHPTYPALTPLKGKHPGTEPLPGVTLEVGLKVLDGSTGKHLFTSNRKGFVFTHQGFSGPAILDVSHFITQNYSGNTLSTKLLVNWLNCSADWWVEQFKGKDTTGTLLRKHLPKRLANNLMEESGIEEKKTAELNKKEKQLLLKLLTEYPLHYTGDLGYKKAEVTGGGVPLDEIDPATMQSRILPGLYLCGEILDVFGRIGGFNFYWAWISGRLAGRAAAT